MEGFLPLKEKACSLGMNIYQCRIYCSGRNRQYQREKKRKTVGEARRTDAEMPQEHAAVPGIFGRDDRHRAQYLNRPRRHIGEIADRRRHYIKRTA